MRSFRDNNRFMFFYDVLGISFASIYREFCVVLSSFVFDVTLISVGMILTADQIVCAQANDWLRCLEYTTFFGTVIYQIPLRAG